VESRVDLCLQRPSIMSVYAKSARGDQVSLAQRVDGCPVAISFRRPMGDGEQLVGDAEHRGRDDDLLPRRIVSTDGRDDTYVRRIGQRGTAEFVDVECGRGSHPG